MKNILLLAFLLSQTWLSAQTFNVSGKVTEANGSALVGASVALLQNDSMLRGMATDTLGKFAFQGVQPGNYTVKISLLGLEDLKKNLSVRDQDIDLGTLVLTDDSKVLKEVKITEQQVTATQQGDTLQFNSGAYKVMKDATAEELLEKIPSVTVENGQVKAQGENVQQVLVDGKPFFGDDPTAALKNIPAELIDKVQIFDAQSEQSRFTGFNDGSTVKTVNIVTKSGMQNGQFGKVYAGYGTDDRYQAGGNLNFFDGNRRLSVIGMANNVNVQNFAIEDLLGATSGGRGNRGGMGGGRQGGQGQIGRQQGGRQGGNSGQNGGGGVGDFLVNASGGITKTTAFGLNFADKWGKKLDVSASYFFNQGKNNTTSSLYRQYYAAADSLLYQEDELSNTTNINHRFNLRLEYQIDSANSIMFRPRLSVQQNKGVSSTLGQTSFEEMLLNETDSRYQSDLTGLNFSGSLLYRHKFGKPGRTISLDLSSGYAPKNGESTQQAFSSFLDETPARFDSLDQRTKLDVNSWNIAGNLEYTEPLSKNSQLLLNYRNSYQQESSDRRAFDWSEATGEYDLLNEPLSNVFSNDYRTQQGGVGYTYNKQRLFNASFRVNAQWATLANEQTFPQGVMLDKTFFNVLPSASMRYTIDRNHNLRLNYRSNTQLPSVQQLQNVVDNSNPLNLTAGNPNLGQAEQHNLFLQYQATDPAKSTVLFFMVGGGLTRDYIANSIYYAGSDNPIFDGLELQPGAQLTIPVNLNDYYTARSFLTYGFPIKKIKSNLNLDLSYNFTRLPGLVNDVTNYSNTHAIGAGLTLSSNISDKVDFTLSTRPTWNSSSNTISTSANTDYLRQNSRLKFNWQIFSGFVLRTELSHTLYQGLAEGYNQQYLLWNAAIGKKLFKNERGEISLAVNDLLDQNRNIQRNITEAYVEDTYTNALTRYVMLTFTYNLRNFNTGKKADAQKRPDFERGSFGPPPGGGGGI